MALAAIGNGGGFCGIRKLGSLVDAPAAPISDFCGRLRDPAHLVDFFHPAVARSTVAAGGRGVAHAIINGDRVRITGVRNFTYRTRDDFDIRYEEREVLISHLQTVDLFVSYWHDGPVGHTFLSFGFDNAPPVAISIETRPEVGEGFDPIASLFKQFELIYLVGDEHDLVGSRAIHRKEDIFLYRIRTTPENARRLFLIYLERINELHAQPEWYHLLSNSCTINIIRYANRIGPSRGFDLRHFLNGFIDRYVYATGAIQTDLPFDELRRRSRINEVVRKEDDAPDFSERIRAGVPTIHP